ncbi:MAG TPA: twin-arginine translocase TatA/TatE family subunit [Candidatus Limnocylindrales bacterium]|nr:twin-arginine translocase TatA/TatE family subunit [Candidatus Limnocylindrales bacterium]
MPNIGPVELIIILVIALIVIGPGRLPDVGAALGKSIREFRKASTEVSDATRIDATATPPATTTPTAAVPPSAAPAPTPQPPSASPTSTTVPAPVVTPPTPPSDDEATNLPA